ncbi:MAG: hypothetical protein JWL85_398 [Candidatus Saccharibacteria bacterium]|nr:hypothetical protein [Candidatus Saccharibacteria bacterium]
MARIAAFDTGQHLLSTETTDTLMLPEARLRASCTLVERNLGGLAVLSHHESEDEGACRSHLFKGERDGRDYVMLVSEPSLADSGLTAVAMPGILESVEGGVGLGYHRALARQLPTHRVVSIATDGIGPNGAKTTLLNWHQCSLDHMAEQGLDLLKTHNEGRSCVGLATSMGSVVLANILNRNIREGKPVDFRGVILNAPALVPPNRVVQDMFFGFLPLFAIDTLEEVFVRTPPRDIPKVLGLLLHSLPGKKDVVPIVRQVYDLLHGTPMDQIETVVREYPTTVITGTDDPVGEIRMWQELQSHYPKKLKLETVARHGHAMLLKPEDCAERVVTIMKRRRMHRMSKPQAA